MPLLPDSSGFLLCFHGPLISFSICIQLHKHKGSRGLSATGAFTININKCLLFQRRGKKRDEETDPGNTDIMPIYMMYTNTDILKSRVLHGNVTFVWLRWPNWVTVLGVKLLRNLGMMIRSGGGHRTPFFLPAPVTECQGTNLNLLSCFDALFLNTKSQKPLSL